MNRVAVVIFILCFLSLILASLLDNILASWILGFSFALIGKAIVDEQ